MTKSPPIDQEERNLAITKLDTTLLVEASAGTGKTTLAIERMLQAIRTGRATMEEIVAITFTEKAAAELKIRLRNAMETVRRAAQGEERQRLDTSVRQLERSHVNTIHGFCSWLLKERPIEAGVDPGFQVLDELETDLLREETWTEWFDQQMEQRPEVLKRALFAELDLSKLRSIAFELVARRDRMDLSQLKPSMHTIADGMAELRAILAEIKPKLANCTDRRDAAYEQIQRLLKLSTEIEAMPPDRLYRQEYELIHSVHVKRNAGAQKNWADKDSLKTIKEAYASLNAIPARRSAALLRDLAAWLKEFVGAFEDAKRKRGALDFDDLLIKTRQLLLNRTDVRAHFQRQFKFLLVDEFQDTDPVQTEIVFFLAEHGANANRWDEVRLQPGKLFLVGDPKQSIYRFRRADIEIYEGAKRIVESQGKVLMIRQSFRTTSSLLAWVNRTFEQLIFPPANGGRYQPSYEELKPSPERQTRSPQVCVLDPTDEQKKIIMGGDVDLARDTEAREVARLIEHVVRTGEWKIQGREDQEQRARRYSDFAILLHSPATSLAAYESALQQQDIPYQVEGGKDYFQSQEVRAVCALLLVLDDPMNARELVGVLRSAVFGFSDEEIYLWAKEHPIDYLADDAAVLLRNVDDSDRALPRNAVTSIQEALALLRHLHEQRNGRSFAGFLELLYQELKLPELFSLRPHGDQRVANLMKLLDVARRLQDSNLLSMREFVDYLRITALDRSEEGQSPSAETQDDVVRVLSIHKAKGLEWSIVVVGDLGGKKRTHHSLVLASRDSGQIALRLGEEMQTEDYEELYAQEKLRQEAEEIRLMYVAATRARDYLVLPWFADTGHYLNLLKHAFDPTKRASEFTRAGKAVAAFFRHNGDQSNAALPRSIAPIRVDWEEPNPPQREEIERLAAQRVEWRSAREAMIARINAGRKRVTPSGLAQSEADAPVRHLESDKAAAAALFGTVMHELLARMDLQRPEEAEQLWGACARRAGLTDDNTRRGAQMIRQFIGTDLFGKMRRAREIHRELPFAYQQGGTLVEGAMDLVFQDEQGWFVVDFKTDQVSESDIAAHAARYRPQLDMYANAIEIIGGMRPAKILMFLAVAREMQLN